MNIIFLGAPGAGKGTQSLMISKMFKIPMISMGNMLREMIKLDEGLKEKVFPYMESGSLVPDEIVGEILKKRILMKDCEKGFILDGYPRNENQAHQLEINEINIDYVIEIAVSDKVIVKRLIGRRICEKCGETFHIEFKKPKEEGICDVCSQKLILRDDDDESTIKKRLQVFHTETEPLREYYKKKDIYYKIDGEKDLMEVEKSIIKIIEENILKIEKAKLND